MYNTTRKRRRARQSIYPNDDGRGARETCRRRQIRHMARALRACDVYFTTVLHANGLRQTTRVGFTSRFLSRHNSSLFPHLSLSLSISVSFSLSLCISAAVSVFLSLHSIPRFYLLVPGHETTTMTYLTIIKYNYNFYTFFSNLLQQY